MVQLTWPHKDTDWASILPGITAVYEDMAREIGKREELLIVAPADVQLPSPTALHAPLSTIRTSRFTSNDTWARDHGFITVAEKRNEGNEEMVLLDFCFNGWGAKFEATLDNQINRHLYEQGLVKGRYEDHLDFVLEGGSIESEERLKQYLGAERVVWINHGSLIGDDTDGHIDTLVRICPDDTLLYTAGDEDHPDLALMESELKTLRTLEGNPYRLLKLPLPRPIYDGDDRLPATYANYLVVNGAVLVPTYAQPDLDAEAMRIVQQAYPDREIVGIDCRAVIKQHGSLHCCTMQYY